MPGATSRFNGLLLEIQYRTRCQHVWASAVELVGQLTPSEPKFGRGDPKHGQFFKLVSEVFARTQEGMSSVHPDLSDAELLRRLEDLDAEINLMAMFRLTKPSAETTTARAVILHLGANGLKVHPFADRGAASGALFKLEKAYPDDDIVLVGADTFESIRSVYRNYFSDAADFVAYYDNGCGMLRDRLNG
jgi:putative GTP pyrophosphokinase